MIELRITFANLGGDPSSRNGHYFRGQTVTEALADAIRIYPRRPLTVQKWQGFPPDEYGEIIYDDTLRAAA